MSLDTLIHNLMSYLIGGKPLTINSAEDGRSIMVGRPNQQQEKHHVHTNTKE